MGTLGGYSWTRIDGLDVGLLVGMFKVERRIIDVIPVFGSVNLIDGGAADSKWEQRRRNTVRMCP